MAVVLLVLPPAVLLAVRLLVDAPESAGPSMFFVHLREMAHPSFWPVFLQSVFSGLGLIPVVLLLRPQAWLHFLQNHSEWMLYLLLSVGLLFGGVDKARLFLYGLPAWVILATQVFEALAQTLPRRRLLAWAGALLVTHGYVGGYLTGTGSFENYLAQWVPVHSEGRYAPYLIRNLLLAVAMMLMSVKLVGRQPADPVS